MADGMALYISLPPIIRTSLKFLIPFKVLTAFIQVVEYVMDVNEAVSEQFLPYLEANFCWEF